MEYLLHIAILAGVFAILAWSLDLFSGHTGLLSVAQAGFFGIGAYASALCMGTLGLSFLPGVGVGILAAAIVSLAISITSLRLEGDRFVIATFGFQIILFNVFNNWMELTRGPLGIPGIPKPVLLEWKVESNAEFLALTLGFAVFTFFVVYLVTSSPFGRVLHAIREDEIFAKAHGKNVFYFKITAFAVSASLAAMAGSLYAHYISYIDPTSFTVVESILVISMVIIGGAGSLWGALVGALVLVALPEALRFVGLPGGIAANVRQIIYGALLVIMMMFRPRGLVGKYGFGK